MNILEALTSMLFIAKENPGQLHYIEFYRLTNFLAIYDIWTKVGIKVSMLPQIKNYSYGFIGSSY